MIAVTFNAPGFKRYSGALIRQNWLTQTLVNMKAAKGPFKAPSIPNCFDNMKF